MSLAITLHVLASILWVGGMFFAHQILRPVAATQLEPPARLPLWAGSFARFFPWVWAAVVILPVTGLWMIRVLGGMGNMGWHIHTMLLLGTVMIALFIWMFFSPYRAFRRAVEGKFWSVAGEELARIRRIVGINLVLGLITAAVAAGGRYL